MAYQLAKFAYLLKAIHKQNDVYIAKTQKHLEEFSSELSTDPIHTTVHHNYVNFTNHCNELLHSTHLINEQFQNEIIQPLTAFASAQMKKRVKSLNTFDSFIKGVNEHKINLEKTKKAYFDSVHDTRQQERNVIKVIESENQDNIKKAHLLLCQLETITKDKTALYQEQLDHMNAVLTGSEITYNEITTLIHNEEQDYFTYIEALFIRMQLLMKSMHSNQSTFIDKMQQSINVINVKRDINLFNNTYDFINEKNTRFHQELFFNYDNYITSVERATTTVFPQHELIYKLEDKHILLEQKNLITPLKASLSDTQLTSLSTNSTAIIDDNINETSSTTAGSNRYKKVILELIHSSNPISNDELVSVFSEIENNIDQSKEFLEQLKEVYDRHICISIENESNMHHLTSIFILILNSFQLKDEIFISFIFTIISMAEETLYIDPHSIFNKYYLCTFLSYKHKKLFTKELWMRLIDIQISFLLDKEIKQLINKQEQLTKTDDSSVLNKVKNIFSLNQIKIKANRKIENNILYSKLHQERQPQVAVKIIEDFLHHFACFNCDISMSNEIIIELAHKYNFGVNYLNYFRAKLNSNLFCAKNETFYQQKHSVNSDIDYSTQKFNQSNCFYHKLTKQNKEENTFIIILSSCKYLHPCDLVNVICVNKSYNKRASNVIYKHILLKYHNMNINTRMNIWKSIINVAQIKKEYQYTTIVSSLKTTGNVPYNDIIDMDVIRTPFQSNCVENKKKITNILKALTVAVPSIKYSQGMNYVAAFILTLFKDEEESFYFYVALLKATQYGELFKNDFEKLKMFFYVFERMLTLFFPELMNYLTSCNIAVSYFISPWFITLFTNAYSCIHNAEQPKVLLMIWEQFLFGGWGEIVKVGTYLIKYYEKQLLGIESEELVQFLLNDLTKTSFFQNENYNTLMYINCNLEIEDGLIKNLENEYELKTKLHNEPQTDLT